MDIVDVANLLYYALEEAREHLEYCGYGDSYERQCAVDTGLDKRIEEALAVGREKLNKGD